jgi:adenylate cyclase
MRKAHEARLYALTTATACGLALLAGVVGAPARAVMQNLVFDQYQRWKPRPYAFDQPVRIVAIDDESLKRLGQWPWPRERLAALVDVLKRAGVASISFDFLFSEKDRGDATAPADNTPDALFARSMDDGAVVLGSFVTELPNGASNSTKAGFVTAGDDAAKFLTPYPGLLSPVPELAQHAAGVGFLNWRPDADRVVRRVPLILNVNGALQPSLAMEALRVAQGASTYIVKSSNASGETAFGQVYGVLAIRNGDLTIPTDATGDVRVYFAQADPRRSIPAWKALEPGADLSDLRGAIVFFGASAALLSDIVATPLSPAMPGVEAHAQIVEQLLSGQTLTRPDWAPSAEWMATARLWRRARSDRRGELVRVFASRNSDRADLSGVFRRCGLFRGSLDALCGETPSGARDPFRLRPVCLARSGVAPCGNAGRARARRLAT